MIVRHCGIYRFNGTEQNRAEPDRTGQNRTEPDRTEPNNNTNMRVIILI